MSEITPQSLNRRRADAESEGVRPGGVRAASKKPENADWFVESLSRGLQVIKAFDAAAPAQRISEISARTGLSRAAVRRLLLTLVAEGYATAEGDRFRLAAPVLDLGFRYLSSLQFPELARPVLSALVRETGCSASIAILDGADTVHICRESDPGLINVHISVGTRLPAYATSLGRVLLAELPDDEWQSYLAGVKIAAHTSRSIKSRKELAAEIALVRQQGWAGAANQVQAGIGGVAVPIVDSRARVRAALNIQRLISAGDASIEAQSYLPALRKYAERLCSAASLLG